MYTYSFTPRTILYLALTAMEKKARQLQEEIIFLERFGENAIVNAGGREPFAKPLRLPETQAKLDSLLEVAKNTRALLKKIEDKESEAFVKGFKEWLNSDRFKK